MRSSLLAAVSLLIGCASADDATAPVQRERALAILRSPAFLLPDSLEVGTPLTLHVMSGAPNGCSEIGETSVVIQGLQAAITPYRYFYKYAACGQMVQQFDQQVTLQFGVAGIATITVTGEGGAVTKPLRVWRRTS